MQIQVNAAHNIEGHEALSAWASDAVGALEKLTRVIDTTLGKQRNQKRHSADLSLPESTPAEE
jgi:hypothetical protein